MKEKKEERNKFNQKKYILSGKNSINLLINEIKTIKEYNIWAELDKLINENKTRKDETKHEYDRRNH